MRSTIAAIRVSRLCTNNPYVCTSRDKADDAGGATAEQSNGNSVCERKTVVALIRENDETRRNIEKQSNENYIETLDKTARCYYEAKLITVLNTDP